MEQLTAPFPLQYGARPEETAVPRVQRGPGAPGMPRVQARLGPAPQGPAPPRRLPVLGLLEHVGAAGSGGQEPRGVPEKPRTKEILVRALGALGAKRGPRCDTPRNTSPMEVYFHMELMDLYLWNEYLLPSKHCAGHARC